MSQADKSKDDDRPKGAPEADAAAEKGAKTDPKLAAKKGGKLGLAAARRSPAARSAAARKAAATRARNRKAKMADMSS